MPTNTTKFAQIELDVLSWSSQDPNNRPLIEPFIPEILALCEKFGKSGQSGGSAPFTAGALSKAIEKLLLFKPIMPILGIDREWIEYSDKSFQNSRCSALFKTPEGSYYLDAIVWRAPKGGTWTGSALLNRQNVRSRLFIKQFPFTPKTFIVNCKETKGGNFTIVDKEELKAAFEYYQKPAGLKF